MKDTAILIFMRLNNNWLKFIIYSILVFLIAVSFACMAKNIPQAKVNWRFETDSPVLQTKVINNRVIVQTIEKIYSLDKSSGAQRWQFNSYNNGGGRIDTFTAEKGLIHFSTLGDDQGTFSVIFSLDQSSGEVLTKQSVDGQVSTIDVDKDNLFLTAYRNDTTLVYALDKKSGKIKWSFDYLSLVNNSDPYMKTDVSVIDDEVLITDKAFHLAVGDTVIALDKETGKLLWVWPNKEQASKETVSSGFLRGYKEGILSIRQNLKRYMVDTVSFDGDSISDFSKPMKKNESVDYEGFKMDYETFNGNLVIRNGDSFEGRKINSLKNIWQQDIENASKQLAADGKLYIAADKTLYVIDPSTGDEENEISLSDNEDLISVDDDLILTADLQGPEGSLGNNFIYIRDIESGQSLSKLELQFKKGSSTYGGFSVLPFSVDGRKAIIAANAHDDEEMGSGIVSLIKF